MGAAIAAVQATCMSMDGHGQTFSRSVGRSPGGENEKEGKGEKKRGGESEMREGGREEKR